MKSTKGFLIAVTLGMFALLGAEDGLQIRTTGGWKKNGNEISLAYGVAKKGPVYISKAVKPHTFYRLSWDVERSNNSPAPVLFVETTRRHLVQFEGNKRVHYWNSGKETILKLRFDLSGGSAGTIKISNISIREVSPDELKNNMIQNGDWEQGQVGDFWQSPAAGVIHNNAVLVQTTDFFSGNRSLCLKPSATGQKYSIRSAYMPIIPGKTFVLTFWAKSDVENTLSTAIDCASPTNIYKGKHPYKGAIFKLTPEWNEYKLEYTVPNNLSVYPALEDRVAKILFNHPGKGSIYLDNLEFRQNEPAAGIDKE